MSGPITYLKHKIDLAVKSMACWMAAVAAGLLAFGFFCAAAFVWTQQTYGTITACLVLGGLFLFVPIVAVVVMAFLRRPANPPAGDPAQLWTDPKFIAAILEAERKLGGGRIASLGLIGAFAVGIWLSRAIPKK